MKMQILGFLLTLIGFSIFNYAVADEPTNDITKDLTELGIEELM